MPPHPSDSSPHICLRSLISGHVQGVGYRYATQDKAQALGLLGWVRNCPDGRVEAMIEGDRAQVEALVDWFWSGPPGARVSEVRTESKPLQQFQRFEIWR
ncbi:acylphosphatase [Lyngbya confervoides]|uniref:Acylphosphatase n=1 Tax=Lyngbya confervoides BDU141951 TaxID=1574623 RepID=A0ABD4T734_9CYAN|nr:acylphosphatase [Lyngbya confervoides]MCM1984293.1 acylphosphatase [Lyngbya confervoides BDU141951]